MDDFRILYHDADIAVAVKPYGVISEDDDSKPCMPALLRGALGEGYLGAVHRLDRTTVGLMAYARSPLAAKRLSAMIAEGDLHKVYLAVIEGCPQEPSGELTDLLYFDRRRNKSYVVGRERRGVKQARLRYEVLRTQGGRSLVRIELLTGRTHQIRVQFASRQMPVVGDRRYGSHTADTPILLCSHELRFRHPITGEPMRFEYEWNPLW